MEHSVFVKYVLNPRVDDEVLMKYRAAVEAEFSEEEKPVSGKILQQSGPLLTKRSFLFRIRKEQV